MIPRRRLVEAALRAQRLDEPRQLRGRRDVAADQAAGLSSRSAAPVLPRRQHVEHDPVEGFAVIGGRRARLRPSAELAHDQAARPDAARRKTLDIARAISAKSDLRSYDDEQPASPTARSSQQDSAPEPAPASTTRAPAKMSAEATICAASLG